MSELERICTELVAVVDEGASFAGELGRSGDQLRRTAGYAASLGVSDGPDLRQLAQILDAAARECRQAAELLNRTRSTARDWSARTVAQGSGGAGVAGGQSSSSGGPSSINGPAATGGSHEMPAGVRSVPGLPPGYALVPLSLVDDSDTGVHGPADFRKPGYTPEDLAWSYEAFETVVLPALARGDPDDLSRRDAAEGLVGCRSYSDCGSGFLTDGNAIKLSLRPDGRFDVGNGYHRLWLARQLGREWVPARVR